MKVKEILGRGYVLKGGLLPLLGIETDFPEFLISSLLTSLPMSSLGQSVCPSAPWVVVTSEGPGSSLHLVILGGSRGTLGLRHIFTTEDNLRSHSMVLEQRKSEGRFYNRIQRVQYLFRYFWRSSCTVIWVSTACKVIELGWPEAKYRNNWKGLLEPSWAVVGLILQT